MKKILWLLLLPGCGGAPFSADLFDPAPSGGDDAGNGSDAPVGAQHPDAGTRAEGGSQLDSASTQAQDSAVCTPFTYPDYDAGSSWYDCHGSRFPKDALCIYVGDRVYEGALPEPCTVCAESLDCTCIMNPGAHFQNPCQIYGGADAGATCVVRGPGEFDVTCK
jgi:hypothetical protein